MSDIVLSPDPVADLAVARRRIAELEAKADADAEEKHRLEAEAMALREGGAPVVEVTLGGNKHRLVMYGSVADRVTLALIYMTEPGSKYKALWAALGLALPHVRQIIRYDGNPLTFGTAVANKLFEEKLVALEICKAGRIAYEFLTADLPMVDGAADFSETPPAGSDGGDGSTGGS